MANGKLKMSNKKFLIIWVPILVVLLAIVIVATAVMNFFSTTMDTYLGGRGTRHEVPLTDEDGNDLTADWDTAYYTKKYDDHDAARQNAAAVSLDIAREGITLMKNKNGALPIAKNSRVTPVGYRYLYPVYGGTGSGGVSTNDPMLRSAQTVMNEFFDVNQTVEDALENGNSHRTAMTATGYTRPNESGGFSGGGATIIEYDPAIYDGLGGAAAATYGTGLVFIGRVGGEGGDIQANGVDDLGGSIPDAGYFDGTPHQLALSEYEKAALRFSKTNCEKTVVVLNSSNIMEIPELMSGDLEADAILWIAGPGAVGMQAAAEIICGDVNPSGKLVDTWYADLMADPTMTNFGNFTYSNLMSVAGGFNSSNRGAGYMSTLEYEEGIYLGYKYYETVDDTNGRFTVFGNENATYADAVNFPFGHGLSYGTDFTQEITSFNAAGDDVTLTVTVTNNGTRAGKDVVQVYYNPPYTTLDSQLKIEKSTVNLVEFAKTTEAVAPNGGHAEVTITFAKEDMASYSYKRENADGTKGAYVLEAGDYKVSINKNSHEEYDSRTVNIGSTIWYDNDNPRQSEKDGQSVLDASGNPTNVPAVAQSDPSKGWVAATNQFQEVSDHMERTDILTRASGTLVNTATAPTTAERTAPDPSSWANDIRKYQWSDTLNSYVTMPLDVATDTYLGNVEGSKVYTSEMPVTGVDNALNLSSFRGVDYYDDLWDDLLDQIVLTEANLFNCLGATYNQMAEIESVGKPSTVEIDGPQGLTGGRRGGFGWVAEPIIAATFNRTLAYRMGEAVGQESMALDAPVQGWYAVGLNIHRTPFSGRNFEYYSEDPLISGIMGARVVSGCGDNGLYTTIKHYAMNDQEMYGNDRSRVHTWATEQSMRELYLRAFEICIKEARMTVKYIADDQGTVATKVMRGSTGIMSSMNNIGYVWAAASYELMTVLPRHEWGFQGMMMTDMAMNAGNAAMNISGASFMPSNNRNQALRAGNDAFMTLGDTPSAEHYDTTSATGVAAIRQAVKNICFTVVNSHSFNNVAPGSSFYYDMAPWAIGLLIGNILIYGFILFWLVRIVLRILDARKNPDKYKSKAKRS